MGSKPDSIAAVHPTEAVDYVVVEADGTHHHLEHGLVAARAALSAGALYAVEQEARNWYGAVAQEYRPEAEATQLVDLNEALAAAMEQYRAEGGAR